jgi:hypothetical protein
VQKNAQDRNLVILAKRKSIITKMRQFEVRIKSECFTKELEYLTANLNNQ